MKTTKQQAKNIKNGSARSSARSGSITAKRSPANAATKQAAHAKQKASTAANGNGSGAKSAMPLTRLDQALIRLGVTPDVLAKAPPISPILIRAAGGKTAALVAMRLSPDEVITTFLDKYDSIPVGDRDILPWEAIGLASGVDLRLLLGSIQIAQVAYNGAAVKVIVLSNQPDVMQARVDSALKAGGYRDRDALDIMTGLLPSPKGPTFIGKQIFGSGANVMNAQGTLGAGGKGKDDDDEVDDDNVPMDPDNIDLEKLFPPPRVVQEKLQQIRQLPAGERGGHWTDAEREQVIEQRRRARGSDADQANAWTWPRPDEDRDKD